MRTIIELFEKAVINYPDNVYLWEKRNGKYEGTTYKETREKVLNLAAGLVNTGFEKGERAALLADGRTDWIISEGLKEGEQVIVNGLQKARPGAPVKAVVIGGPAPIPAPAVAPAPAATAQPAARPAANSGK